MVNTITSIKLLTKQEILLALLYAIQGEVYPAIRAIAYRYDPDTQHFMLRHYLDRNPLQKDYECIKNVLSKFVANFVSYQFNKVDAENHYFRDRTAEIDSLDGFVYVRKELYIDDRDIRLSLQRALVRAIYPAIRAIAYSYNPDTRRFVLRYYLDREPTENDYEEAGCVTTEVFSDFNNVLFDDIQEECYYSDSLLSRMDGLDGFVYMRYEPMTPEEIDGAYVAK
ncbi:hypothetical protein AGMMS50229_03420 [Campylobacterota bacterium]|nr:hypothetical protein AGMMS50229_03420 [Campylobacterota bacterium]